MTIYIQETGDGSLLGVEGSSITIRLWPGAVAALKARNQAEQQEWLLRNIEEFSKRDGALLRSWFGAAIDSGDQRRVRT